MNTARHCAGPCSVSAITPMPTPDIAPQPAPRAIRAVLKVPEVTAYFWIIKLLSTAMGESTSDYLVFQINPYIAVVLGCLGLVVALLLQLWVRRYVAWIYWLAVVMVAVFGTMAADVTHVVTRPLGASFADWLGKPCLGGLGLGDQKVAPVLTILIIGFVGYLTISGADITGRQRIMVPLDP